MSVVSISTEQTSRFRHTQQLHRNEIKFDKHHEHEKFQVSESCKFPCSFINVLPVLGFDHETPLSGSHIKDYLYSTFH